MTPQAAADAVRAYARRKTSGPSFLRITIAPGGVRDIEDRVAGGRSHLVQGPPAAVKAYVDQLFKQYPTEGYGTRTVAWEPQPGGDWVEAIVHRAASCE